MSHPIRILIAALALLLLGVSSTATAAPRLYKRVDYLTKLSLFGDPYSQSYSTGYLSIHGGGIWGLSRFGYPADSGDTGITGHSPFDQDEGLSPSGAWEMAYSQCASPSDCQLESYTLDPHAGYVVNPIAVTTPGANMLPSAWLNHLAWVHESDAGQQLLVQDLTSQQSQVIESAPHSTATATGIDLEYPQLAVAWRWMDSKRRVATRIDLINVQTGSHRTLLKGGPGTPRQGELISPTVHNGLVYFALSGTHGRYYRWTVATARLASRGAPSHVTSFVVGSRNYPDRRDVVLYETAARGNGPNATCRTSRSRSGCRLWTIAFPGPFAGFR